MSRSRIRGPVVPRVDSGSESAGRALGLAALIGFCCMVVLPHPVVAAPVPVLQVLQRTQGLPDGQGKAQRTSVLQTLTVDTNGARILLDSYQLPGGLKGPLTMAKVRSKGRVKQRLILRMDLGKPVVWEVDMVAGTYREEKGDLNRYQLDRRMQEDNLIRRALRLPEREREAVLKKDFLRRDYKRIVEVVKSPASQVLGYDCEHLRVTENGRLILDAYISENVPGARSYYQLYRRLGVFSEEVLDAIDGVKGLPLKATIGVVTALPPQQLEVEVLEVAQGTVPEELFNEPQNLKRADELPDTLKCAHCGKAVRGKRVPHQYKDDTGAVHFFDEATCYEAWLDLRKRGGGQKK
jgi:hypothetical protein